MIKVVEYVPEHLEQINKTPLHDKDILGAVSGPAVTLMSDSGPIAIVGGTVILPGVLHGWACIGDGVKAHPVSFHKTMWAMVRYFMASMRLRRIQISVRCDYEMGQRWARSLGFQPEGIMLRYSEDGTASWLMSRTS